MKIDDNKNLTYYLILIISALPNFLVNYRVAYIIYLIILIINFKHIIKGVSECRKNPLPLFFFSCWVYGVILGYAYGNGMNSLYNYFGMVFLLTTYVLIYDRFPIKKIISVVIYAGILQAIFQLVPILYIGDFDLIHYLNQDARSGFGVFRVYYDIGFGGTHFIICSFIILTLLKKNDITHTPTVNFFVTHKWVINFVLFSAIFVTGSKGYYLAFAVSLFVRYFIYKHSYRKLIMGIIFIIAMTFLLSGTHLLDSIKSSYDSSEISNAVREVQATLIKEEWTVFGKGLGTPLLGGYERGDLVYAVELTYHSIVHKMGYIVGGLFIICLFYKYVQSIVKYWVSYNIKDAVAFSLLSCLIPAYGNPSLFSPFSVMAICIAMYCLNIKENFKVSSYPPANSESS